MQGAVLDSMKIIWRVSLLVLSVSITLIAPYSEAQSPASATSTIPVFESTNLWNAGVGGYACAPKPHGALQR